MCVWLGPIPADLGWCLEAAWEGLLATSPPTLQEGVGHQVIHYHHKLPGCTTSSTVSGGPICTYSYPLLL